ncbi:metal-dependent hydrolase [Streptomyces sp. NPDC050147]|uniref:metal-dependent hydrolase n=1 Tax=Streptomyces sp. NPDC050147 TaxID=3155513 RepID=UPI00343E62BD
MTNPHTALRHLPRDVRFDWSDLPLHWVPNEPQVTHTLNTLHLLLPEGERWFCRVFQQALPMVTDERLRERLHGFIGQEVIHARAHEEVHGRLRDLGLDIDPYLRQMEWHFRKILTPRDEPTSPRYREQVTELAAIVAAAEHFTAHLGAWVLDTPALDSAGTHPAMLDLLRWHGAEEVEHSSVAFDLLTHLDPGYARRLRTAALTEVNVLWLLTRGARYLMSIDPQLRGSVRFSLRAHQNAARRGLLWPLASLGGSALRYARPKYHPSLDFDLRPALAYLARSPAARAADRL